MPHPHRRWTTPWAVAGRALRRGSRRRALRLAFASRALGLASASLVLWFVSAAPSVDHRVPPDPAEPPHNCRFWAIIGEGEPPVLLREHLLGGSYSNLKELSFSNRDGWGIASFLSEGSGVPLNRPLIRRGGPPAYHDGDPDYDAAVEELDLLHPRAALAHVRAGSSGHWGVPDPHPFLDDGYAFVHNGSAPVGPLLELLAAGDEYYLDHHPPDWREDFVDSELYFLYLLKALRGDPHAPVHEVLANAIRSLVRVIGDGYRLNFAMTAGDTLYALRYASNDTGDALRFHPSSAEVVGGALVPSPYWVVASQVLGSDPSGWAPIPARTLAVFVPGSEPRFVAIRAVTNADADGEPPEGAVRESRDLDRQGLFIE